MNANNDNIDKVLSENLDNYIQSTAQLCAQPSVSARGEGMDACAEMVVQLFNKHGFQVELISTPGNPIVVARAQGQSERTMLFYNHYDVQPPEPLELWTTPPFEPTLRDGASTHAALRTTKVSW